MPKNEMLDEAVRNIQNLKTKFVSDLDRNSSDITLQKLDNPISRGGGTWIQNDGGVHAYDSFCEPALEKIAKNHTRH